MGGGQAWERGGGGVTVPAKVCMLGRAGGAGVLEGGALGTGKGLNPGPLGGGRA